ncbi:hypothetical protein SPSIL_051680 [Sporomusa silvacetica DSM 10669]|uniref:Uncharacterized protein n=1 Tax=Sporomusa silvacetica DSM 10669 TaxID=1123289 RepID=A0ABZ3ITM1_9FIRM|nr:hypothetical protein [Sporomusa silvacetica]OZC19799.1 hypothetical protein SPSIL_19260 [Sporomusa silvacetica DSM 10669]
MSKITPLNFGISNLTLIQDSGMIIVDTGCQSEKEAYVKAFAELGINLKILVLLSLRMLIGIIARVSMNLKT